MNCRDFIYAASVGAASATMPTMTVAQANRESRNDAPQVATKLRTITLEEHFASPGWFAGPGKDFTVRAMGARGAKILARLKDVGDGRIAEMDAAGIDVQVLSLNSPGVEQADVAEQIAIARKLNDFLVDAVNKNPKRFAAFAALPVAAPEQAADELDRRVRQQASRARSSTAIRAAAIWTINSSGRSWSALKRSTFRFICIRRCPRNRSPRCCMAASLRP